MRKLIAGLFISLDGVVEAPDQWQLDFFDEDMGKAMQSMLDKSSTALMGRVTYQAWADYWPNASDEPFASWINNIPKYVASTTLKDVSWRNTSLLKGPLADDIARLKQQPGQNITVTGSPTLVRSLLKGGLLDELTLSVHPVVVGRGERLFHDGDDLKRLKLLDSSITGSGVAILTYQTSNAQ